MRHLIGAGGSEVGVGDGLALIETLALSRKTHVRSPYVEERSAK
jgi:hypothetical protein